MTNVSAMNINKKYLRNNRLPWVDKYRPHVLRDVIGHDEIKDVLKRSIELGNLPHLLFHGGSGTGKTSTVLAIAMQLYGPRKINQKVMELNASDENGINVVREKIISFAKIVVGTPDLAYPSPNFKMIILDEADSMTGEAQTALKKVMEVTCDITRFVFICNYENKIIEPIKSRCASFRFKPIPESMMINKLKEIALKENLNVPNDVYHIINEICQGDLRQSIMTLQVLKYMHNPNKVTRNDIYTMTSYMDGSLLDLIWDRCLKCDVSELVTHSTTLTNTGYPINNILKCIKNKVLGSEMRDDMKALICIHTANIERMLAHGSSNQLLSVLAFINGLSRGIQLENYDIF